MCTAQGCWRNKFECLKCVQLLIHSDCMSSFLYFDIVIIFSVLLLYHHHCFMVQGLFQHISILSVMNANSGHVVGLQSTLLMLAMVPSWPTQNTQNSTQNEALYKHLFLSLPYPSSNEHAISYCSLTPGYGANYRLPRICP